MNVGGSLLASDVFVVLRVNLLLTQDCFPLGELARAGGSPLDPLSCPSVPVTLEVRDAF